MSGIFEGILRWVGGLIGIAIVCGVMGIIGYTGLLIRRGSKWPMLLWVVVYAVLFFMLPIDLFLWSLTVLVMPLLGFFGIFFVPDVLGYTKERL